MTSAVVFERHGACANGTVRKSKDKFTWSRRQLHVHHKVGEHGLIFLSPNTLESLQSPQTPVFDATFPPPLNAYVYPMPLIVARVDDADRLVDFDVETLSRLTADLWENRNNTVESSTVYDVPAVPLMVETEDFVEEDAESIEDEEEEEEAASDSDAGDDDLEEEEWDDEEGPTAIAS